MAKIEAERPPYGQAQVQDAALAAAAEATPGTPPGPDAQAVQEALAQQQPGQEMPAKEPKTPVAAEAPADVRVQNRFMLLPPGINFKNQEKTPVEREHDTGLFWNVLASSKDPSPVVRAIAGYYNREGE